MLAAPSVAIDLPLKILVAEDLQGKVWISYNSSEYLKDVTVCRRICCPISRSWRRWRPRLESNECRPGGLRYRRAPGQTKSGTESGTGASVCPVGRLVALRETEAIVFESQAGVVRVLGRPVAETATPPGLPCKIRSGVSFRRGKHQRQGDGRGDQSASQCDGFEPQKITVGGAVGKHGFFPGPTPALA